MKERGGNFMNIRKIFFIWIAFVFHITIVFADTWGEKIERLKPSVVNLEVVSQVGLETYTPGSWYGTGFIVDAKKGIVATNQHIASVSPVQIKINFIDGSSTSGKVLYYDYTHDFAFIQFDPASVSLALQEVKLGSSFDLKLQDEVLLIGNSEGEAYTVKLGRVANLVVDKGDRHSATIHTTIDRAGGASGSAVFNEKEEVIGLHYKGSDTSSFELRIEYIKDALLVIQKGEKPKRGEIGIQLNYLSLDDAIHHLGIQEAFREIYKTQFPQSHKVTTVLSVIPCSSAFGVLKAGDVILSVNDQMIGDNLYLLDKLIDEKVDQKVKITVLRFDGNHVFELFVQDAEKQKIKKFVLLGGAVFHDLSSDMRRIFHCEEKGVLMNRSEEGSIFQILGSSAENSVENKRVLVKEIAGQPIDDLNTFIQVVSRMEDKQGTYVVFHDLRNEYKGPRVTVLTFNLTFGPLRVFVWDENTHSWIKQE